MKECFPVIDSWLHHTKDGVQNVISMKCRAWRMEHTTRTGEAHVMQSQAQIHQQVV